MKSEILTLLRESGGYLSGQELCKRFDVSRTAVWKVINQLKEEGYQIEAVQNKGYRLLASPDVLSVSELRSRLQTKWIAGEIRAYETVDSTNLEAKRCAQGDWSNGTLILADTQTAGRGRRGRSWESPVGVNLFYTLLLKPDIAPNKASMLTLVMALSVAEGIGETTGSGCAIKWPNDVVINGRKVCGILTEMDAERDYIHSVVIGAGVNVNMETLPPELRDKAASLLLECGKKVPRSVLLASILRRFEIYYELFLQTEDLSLLQEAYNSLLVNRNQTVRVLDPQNTYEGIAQGINTAGELLVRRADNTVEAVYAGEVSVRGLYGYV